MISVVVESWNVDGDPAALERVLALLQPQLGDAELVVTASLGLPASATYYDHKNAGFDATHGDIVAFIDGDCEPSADWLAQITAPIAAGRARVVAGATSYRGALAPLANQLDFPYFHGPRPDCVRNFFANNVAFARDVFAERRYPDLAPMFHGQCQVLGLQLLADDIPIVLAPDARVLHAWPGSAREWLEVRLLRGADMVSLLPYVLDHYTPRAAPVVARFGRLPALALLGVRAITGTLRALRTGPTLRGLALVAGVTVVDMLGAAAGPQVYRALT